MAAPKGNRFWELRTSHGRKPIEMFQDAELLKNSCFEYFEKTSSRREWDEQNWVGKDGDEVTKNKVTPFSIKGLCVFLDITFQTWQNHKEAGNDKNATALQKDIFDIITRVEEIIETQQFEGAVTGHFQANIIARKLGLSDKSEVSVHTEQPLFNVNPSEGN